MKWRPYPGECFLPRSIIFDPRRLILDFVVVFLVEVVASSSRNPEGWRGRGRSAGNADQIGEFIPIPRTPESLYKSSMILGLFW